MTKMKKKRKNINDFFVKQPLPPTEQEHITARMIDYIVGDAKPISTVDSAYFRRLVGSLNSRCEMVGRMGMASLIANEFDSYKKELMNLVKKIDVVCLTADSWSSKHRAFLGVTIHWLDPTTMKKVSKALALKRFLGIYCSLLIIFIE